MPAKKISIARIEYDPTDIEAVKKLRLEKFAQKQPFRINDNQLPSRKFYLEFKDGSIHLARLQPDNKTHYVEKILNPLEEWEIRRKHNLSRL